MDSSSDSMLPSPPPKKGRVAAAAAIGATALVAVGAAVQSHLRTQANANGFLEAVVIRSINQFQHCAADANCAKLGTGAWAAKMPIVERIVSPTPTVGQYSAAEVGMHKWLTTVDATLKDRATLGLFSLGNLGTDSFHTAFKDLHFTGAVGATPVALSSSQKSKVLKMLESSAPLPNPFLTGADATNQVKMENLHAWLQHAPASMAAMGKRLIDPAASGHATGLQGFKNAYFKEVSKVTALGNCYSSHGAGAIAALNAAIVSSTTKTEATTDLPDVKKAGTDSTTKNAAAITSTATTVTVADGTKLKANSFIKIGTEFLFVKSIATNTLTVLRGQCGTSAAAHQNTQTINKAANMKLNVKDVRASYAQASAADRQAANAQMALQVAAVPALST